MEELIALVHALIRNEIEQNLPTRGARGLRGANGEFIWDDHQEKVQEIISDKIDSIKDLLKLNFKDLTNDQKDLLKLRFDNLSDDEKFSLKGEKGDRGLSGRNGQFIWEDNEIEIDNIIKDYFETIKDSLRFNYNDFTEEQLIKLRGDKGPRGQKGKSFCWDARKDEVFDQLKEIFNSEKETLELTYEKLTQEEKDSLKLKFSDLTPEEVEQITGARGLKGKSGDSGEDGQSVYEIWKDQGNEGTEEDFFESLKVHGAKGKQGKPGLDGVDGKDGSSGQSVYEIWKDQGNKGTEEDFFESLKVHGAKGKQGKSGLDGTDGKDGVDGKSVLETWKNLGNEGTEEDLVESLKVRGHRGYKGQRGKRGSDGEGGKSAYELWLEDNKGDLKDFLNSLIGKEGKRGIPGLAGIPGIQGRKGEDGQNGQNAPRIVDVEVIQKDEKFFFVFHFDNNTFIETDYITLPIIKKTINNMLAYGGGPDHHSGIDRIISGRVTIAENKQSVIYDGILIENESELAVAGTLIIRNL